MIMALQVFTDLMALIWQHPFLSGLTLVLFTPPFFPIVKFFSPLLISTALFMLALFTMGPRSSTTTTPVEVGEDWEFRRAADVKVWEDKSVVDRERMSNGRKADGSWMDWVSSIQESGLSWLEAQLKNDNWKGLAALNDDNVSILQETSWVKADLASTSGEDRPEIASSSLSEEIVTKGCVPALIAPSVLFKVDSGLKKAAATPTFDKELGEDGPESEDAPVSVLADAPAAVAPEKAQSAKHSVTHASTVHHEPLENLQIPKKIAGEITTDSPMTDLDDSSDLERSKRLLFATVRRDSMNLSSGLSSDADTPVAVVTLSKSGKLKQMENLGDLMEDREHGEKVPQLQVLKPTTADEVQDVKEKLEGFISEVHKSSSHGGHREEKAILITEKKSSPPMPVNALLAEKKPSSKAENPLATKAPGSPLFKAVKGAVKKNRYDSSSSSGEEVELDSDSDSDSEFEIFPPVDPAKMKLHPPVKLDIQQLEKKLGTSLSQRTSRATSPRGEITEVK